MRSGVHYRAPPPENRALHQTMTWPTRARRGHRREDGNGNGHGGGDRLRRLGTSAASRAAVVEARRMPPLASVRCVSLAPEDR